MITIYGKTLEDYKRQDPDGAFGYWMDLAMTVSVVVVVTSPAIAAIAIVLHKCTQ